MSKTSSSSSSGIGFVGLLAIVFIVLKLIGQIDWPWVWVLSPIWISFTLMIALILVVHAITKKSNKGISKKSRKLKKSRFQERLDEALKNQQK